ncbi:hypothetical protein [Nocardioides sp. B-3]|uniref:hypothetical protein n=1 Tax=Nocardioides sp. B-3 TaxID=2895565 RepID=UPI002152B171|nr:hypothetical protein [Nocardioides sp. B-3]UUZ59653.1 hypothetical protein LP418_00390 [Nocardioides sp. B-3]
MSSTAVTRSEAGFHGRPPRVREQARDAVTLMVFSAAMSAGLTAALFVLMHVGR